MRQSGNGDKLPPRQGGVFGGSAVLVRDVMQRKVAVVRPDARLALAACMMRDQDVGCLPVMERGRLIGMITDRDIVVRGVAEGLDPHHAIVSEAMSANAIACSIEHTVGRARELMATYLIEHLPVVDRRDRVVGLVSLRDITGQFARCKPRKVTFYKRVASSSGHARDVEIGKVYLSPALEKDDVVPAALARFEHDHGLARWEEAADLYALEWAG
jgi:CBS domain-containing protein